MSSKNYLAGEADDGVAAILDMNAEITRLRAEVERLRAALAPRTLPKSRCYSTTRTSG